MLELLEIFLYGKTKPKEQINVRKYLCKKLKNFRNYDCEEGNSNYSCNGGIFEFCHSVILSFCHSVILSFCHFIITTYYLPKIFSIYCTVTTNESPAIKVLIVFKASIGANEFTSPTQPTPQKSPSVRAPCRTHIVRKLRARLQTHATTPTCFTKLKSILS